MHIYCKKCNKHTGNTFPKKLIFISKNKIKGKSKCANCLTKRSFIHEFEYDLENELQIYLQFFTNWCYKKKWRLIAWSVKKVLKILIQKCLEQKIADYLCNENVVIVKIKSQDL